MTFNEYQQDALRTAGLFDSNTTRLAMMALGLAGEAGEAADYIKKHLYHGHVLERQTLAKELGDILWYVSAMADAIGYNLETIAKMNVKKLEKRYPEGFSSERSISRKDF